MPIGTDIAQIILGIMQSRRQRELLQMQKELNDQKLKEMKQEEKFWEKLGLEANSLPDPYRTEAKIKIGNAIISQKEQTGEIGGKPYKISGGGWMPGLPETIASQQVGGGMEGMNPLYKAMMFKKFADFTMADPRVLKNMWTPGGPASIMVDPYTMQPTGMMPEYQAPQFQEETLPSGEKRRRWMQPPGWGGGTTQPFVTELGEADKPIKEGDIPLYIHPQTLESPPIGTTPRQAMQTGFKRMTTNARNQIDASKGVISVAANIEQLMQEVFPKTGGALDIGRITRKAGAKLQTNPKATEFDALINGTLAPFIRALGEKGTLADNDIARAKALMPQLTDTADVAWNKLNRLKKLFEEIQQSVISGRYDVKKGVSGGINLKPGKKQEDPLGLR